MLPTLPTPPSRSNPTDFSAQADAFLAALPGWTDAANALEQSLQLVATTGTSTSSVTVGVGSKSLVTQPGKAWVVGSFVYLVSAASIGNRMSGQVTAYDSSTGALTVNVNTRAGSGTYTSWIIGLATATAVASDVAVDDSAGYFVAATVETVLTEIFLAVRSASWLFAEAGGSANALTASFTPTVTSLSHGQIVYVRAASANTGAATFQADATTARSIYKGANQALLPGDIAGAGHLLILRRDATLNKYELLNPARGLSDSAAPGTVKMFAGETPPAGWMELDGSSLVMADYPDLYAAIGTLHGSADGTHFNLPDMRGVFPRGWSHGTTANDPDVASRVAAATGGATGDHVGSKQGWQIQSHSHSTLGVNNVSGVGPGSGLLSATSTSTGSTGGNQTNPVNINVMFIIKY